LRAAPRTRSAGEVHQLRRRQ